MDGQMLVQAIREGGGDASLGRVRDLVGGGADVNARAEDGSTPLEIACANEAWETARFLLKAGAEALACDDCFYHPLFNAMLHGPRDVVEALLERGFAWEDLIEKHPQDPPFNEKVYLRECSNECAFVIPFEQLLSEKQFDRLEWLCELGAKRLIDLFENMIGTNALGHRVEDGDIEGVTWLLDRGAWIDPVTTFDLAFLPIDRAVMNQDLEMVSLLIERGANPNIRNWMNLNAVDRARHVYVHDKPGLETARRVAEIVSEASARFPMHE